MSRNQCLTHDELTALSLGELPPTVLQEFAAHLENCVQCETAAQELDGLSDPMLDAYRRSAQTSQLTVSPSAPQRVGEYEILGEIGRGGMGIVYRARHRRLQRVVALKMLLGGSFALPDELARFRAEAEAVARLQHPNIVQIYEIGEHEADPGLSRPYFTLEFVDGGSLSARVAGRPQSPREAAAWIETLARATHYAHCQGIIHRDLKPSNVLLTADAQPKICDFGVAKFLTSLEFKTQSGMLVGTAEYMAPEQAAGERQIGPAVDIYALGAILYTLLTGRPPFQGVSPLHTLEQVRHHDPVTPSRLQPRIPRDLETICLKCLEKPPAKRYATALDLADDLRRFLSDEPIRARRVSPWEQSVRWVRRHKPLALAVSAVVLSLAVATTISALAAIQKEAERVKARNAESLAVSARNSAEEERDRALRNLYVARTNLAGRVLDTPTGLAQVAQLFSDWRGRRLRSDPRGWEWYYYQTLANRSELTLHGHALDVTSLAWRPDGASLASGGMDGSIRLWDTATGKEQASLKIPWGALSLAWRPDGKRLVSANFPDKTLTIWDAVAGTPLHTLTGHAYDIWKVAWNSDGRRFASADAGGTVIVWDAERSLKLVELKGEGAVSPAICWSPDGKYLAISAERTVKICAGASGKALITLSGHKADVTAVAWCPTEARIATLGRDQTIILWDAANGKQLRAMPVSQAEDFPDALNWSPDGRRLATSHRDLTVAIWDVATGQQQQLLRGHTGSHIAAVAWNPAGDRLASAERGWNGTIKIWNTNIPADLPFSLGADGGGPVDVCWSPDNHKMASGHRDGTVKIWDVAKHACTATLRDSGQTVWRLSWSPDSRLLAGGCNTGVVYLWNTTDWRLQDTLPDKGSEIESLTWSNDSAHLAYGLRDSRVAIWEVGAGVRELPEHPGMRGTLRPQGGQIAVGLSYGIKIVDANSGAEIRSWRNAEVGYNYPSWDPDGPRVATLSDFAVEVRDVATGAVPYPPLTHLRRVDKFAWSPTGRQLITCTEDHNLHLWDAVDGNPILTFSGPAQDVVSIAWSPDGTRIMVVAKNGDVSIWDAAPGYVAERASASLAGLNSRLDEHPNDLKSLRLRAGVFARQGAWDGAAADAGRLVAAGAPTFFQAGWWLANIPHPDSPATPAMDVFKPDPVPDSSQVRWYISADDPNGYVPLHNGPAIYFTRLFVPQSRDVDVEFEVPANLDARQWLNGDPIDFSKTHTLTMAEGWNTLAVRLDERSESSNVLLRHGAGFYLRLRPTEPIQ